MMKQIPMTCLGIGCGNTRMVRASIRDSDDVPDTGCELKDKYACGECGNIERNAVAKPSEASN